MTKWLVSYSCKTGAKWRFVEFGGPTGAESYGIVDILAIRKDHRPKGNGTKRGDLFEMVLIQTKGGTARFPSESEVARLSAAANYHRAKAVVLAVWRLGAKPDLYKLVNSTWQAVSPKEVFG